VVGVQPRQRADVLAVVAGQDRVEQQALAGRQQRRAQRPHADERAGRELEVLGDATAEDQPCDASSGSTSATASPVRRKPSSSKASAVRSGRRW
jgi:hypothetical protein